MISRAQSRLGQIQQGYNIEISIVIPTYNEKENLIQFVDELKSTLGENINHEIIIVDDNSPDGTGKIADELSRTNKDITVIHRPEKMGLASALIEGFKVSEGEFVLVSDADLQHSPALTKIFLEEINQGADLVIASRYVTGAEINGWSPWRKIVSKGAIAIAHVLLPKTRRIRDPISGYFMVRKDRVFTNRLKGIGWKLLLEILLNGGFQKVVEISYIFKPRINGKSKFKIRECLDYLILLFILREQKGKQMLI